METYVYIYKYMYIYIRIYIRLHIYMNTYIYDLKSFFALHLVICMLFLFFTFALKSLKWVVFYGVTRRLGIRLLTFCCLVEKRSVGGGQRERFVAAQIVQPIQLSYVFPPICLHA